MDRHPGIVFRSGAAGRRPALAGSRIDVWKVIERLRDNENSIEETAWVLGLPAAVVRACVSYYAEHQDEIDEWTARMHDYSERAEQAWRREQALLAS